MQGDRGSVRIFGVSNVLVLVGSLSSGSGTITSIPLNHEFDKSCARGESAAALGIFGAGRRENDIGRL